MIKGRKTTQQERAEIVAFCIEHGKDYLQTIKQYGVSYQQIHSWVRKYEEKRIDGFADKRGRTKPIGEVTAENILNRDFYADKPNEKRLTDVFCFFWGLPT